MKNCIKLLGGIAFAATLCGAAHAAITTSVATNSTTGIAGITTWPIAFSDTSVANPSTYTTGENNYGPSTLFSLAQSWTATATGRLTDVQIAISGAAPVSFDVSLYDAGTSGFANNGSATYTPGSGGVSANLFTDTAGETWSGYTLGGADAAVLNFDLTGADSVVILAGHQYIFEISSTSNPSSLLWFRNPSDATDYPGGQAFRQRSALSGNGLRDFSIAVTTIPEPSSLALMGIGALLTGLVIRRRKS